MWQPKLVRLIKELGAGERIRLLGYRKDVPELCHAADAFALASFREGPVPCDKRGLNYDKYFKTGDTRRNPMVEFDSSNTAQMTVEQVKQKLLSLRYIRERLTVMEAGK